MVLALVVFIISASVLAASALASWSRRRARCSCAPASRCADSVPYYPVDAGFDSIDIGCD